MKKNIIVTVHRGIDTKKAIESYCIRVNKKRGTKNERYKRD